MQRRLLDGQQIMILRIPLKVIIPLVLVAIATTAWIGTSVQKPELVKIHETIEESFQQVEHISGDEYLALDPEKIVVFDVREPDEYDVSHIAGAVRIDPDIDPESFAEEFKNLLPGKTAVFYCSVGWRSSELAQRVNSVLTEEGVIESFNLTGGLFQWHNEAKPMTNDAQDITDRIHPYDDYWGKLIDDESSIQYRAQPSM